MTDTKIAQQAPLNFQYYQRKEGRWRGRFRFAITDVEALAASGLGRLDRWSLRMTDLLSRSGKAVLATTLDAATGRDQNEVLHTTRLSIFGITLLRSDETMCLDTDGRNLVMKGRQSAFPWLAKPVEWIAPGAVAEDHDGAVYHIPFYGTTIKQEMRMTPEGLEMTQTSPFSEAVVVLKRQRPLGRS